MSGDHRIGRHLLFVHAEIVAPMFHEHIEFTKGAGIEEVIEPFPGGHLSFSLLRGDRFFPSHLKGFFLPFLQILDLIFNDAHYAFLSSLVVSVVGFRHSPGDAFVTQLVRGAPFYS